jgi:hypothetical protein
MKRENELMQKLLVRLEELPAQPGDVFLLEGSEPELAIEGYSSGQIEYHLTQLKSEGYIESPGSQPMVGVTFRSLTPRGHDYVEQYREAARQQETKRAAEESQKWIGAAEAARLLKPVFNSEFKATRTICQRAHAGLIPARAERFMVGDRRADEREIPREFWWGGGSRGPYPELDDRRFRNVDQADNAPQGLWRFILARRHREDDSGCARFNSPRSYGGRSAAGGLVGRPFD